MDESQRAVLHALMSKSEPLRKKALHIMTQTMIFVRRLSTN